MVGMTEEPNLSLGVASPIGVIIDVLLMRLKMSLSAEMRMKTTDWDLTKGAILNLNKAIPEDDDMCWEIQRFGFTEEGT